MTSRTSTLVRQCLALLLRSKSSSTPLVPTTTAQLHALLLTSGHLHYDSPHLLLYSYCACGCPFDAQNLLAQMPQPASVSVSNTLLRSYSGLGFHRQALALYSQMRHFDHLTFTFAAKACAGLRLRRHGRAVHGRALAAGFGSDAYVQNAIVSMYMRCRDVAAAEAVFVALPSRTTVSWNTVITGCVKDGRAERALEVFETMVDRGVCIDRASVVSVLPACAQARDLHTGRAVHRLAVVRGLGKYVAVKNALIDMYGKCGSLEDARRVFDEDSYDKDVVSWTVMIGAYVLNDHASKAFALGSEMLVSSEAQPNAVTMAHLLSACASLLSGKHAKCTHALCIRLGLGSDIVVETALVDCYAKCGYMGMIDMVVEKGSRRTETWNAAISGYTQRDQGKKALALFKRMLAESDVVAWTTVIAGYGMHGHAQTAMLLYSRMVELGVMPNTVTIASLLHSCSHAGMVDEGLRLFNDMHGVHGLMPNAEHYLCLVDMLGRAGRIEEAYRRIEDMPFEPTVLVWSSLLGACVLHENVEFGEVSAKHLFELEPDNVGNYVLLGKVYAAADRWSDVQHLRRVMEGMDLHKDPGYCVVDAKSEVC
ncbi:Pentatricopeptide repeat-containing protein [Zea mays]|uniref:Pentatricopeptide repeat-containing protein n=1 Tax=Zea mays TaxID=4577 RepID=A0A3L6EP87_MAIZE|nr:Pentatricopeptide repeat-containing protein [Zea mays]